MNLKGKMRGQAAMEYLMTYGWALLVIVIVIAILLIINPFSAPQGCRFDDLGFSCGSSVVNTQGQVFMAFTNGHQTAIKDVQVVCTTDKSPTADTSLNYVQVFPESGGSVFPRQATVNLDGIQCYDKGGSPVRALNVGEDFSGKIWVFYHNDDDGVNYPLKAASASFVTKVGA